MHLEYNTVLQQIPHSFPLFRKQNNSKSTHLVSGIPQWQNVFSSAELRGQVYTGGAGGLGRRLRGGVQHQRPHFLHQRQEHPAADSGGTRGKLQRVRSNTIRVLFHEGTQNGLEAGELVSDKALLGLGKLIHCGSEQFPVSLEMLWHYKGTWSVSLPEASRSIFANSSSDVGAQWGLLPYNLG